MEYQIKTADLDEIRIMLEWARIEGWNPGLDDASTFQKADPSGFFIGYLNGAPVAAISNVRYSSEFSFLGLYIVKPEFRGLGLGYKIWQHALNYSAGAARGLDGVVEQQANYVKSGFKLEQRNIRYSLTKNAIRNYNDANLKTISLLNLQMVLTYDADFFPAKRDKFLTAWLLAPHAKSLAYLVNNEIQGYGVIRKCSNGYKIGPLFADKQEVAMALFQGLCSSVAQNQSIFLDIPESNLKAKELVDHFKMDSIFETARMYTQPIGDISMSRTYGITSFELG